MRPLLILLASLFFLHYVYGQDTALDKMNKTRDRNRHTDTVKVAAPNDQMNIYDKGTGDSLLKADSLNNLRKQDTAATASPQNTKAAPENVWVSRSVWIALIAILLILLVKRRRKPKQMD